MYFINAHLKLENMVEIEIIHSVETFTFDCISLAFFMESLIKAQICIFPQKHATVMSPVLNNVREVIISL